jgi:hypothetical protein
MDKLDYFIKVQILITFNLRRSIVASIQGTFYNFRKI